MKNLIYLVGLLIFLFSCKKDDMGESFTPIESGMNGSVQKGPYLTGSSITIQELADGFIPNGKTYITSTENDFGEFSIKSTINTQFVEIIAQGFYYNEIVGEISSANLTLKSLVKIEEELITNVNVLTTLSKDRIIYLMENGNINFKEAKKQTEREILSIFGITEDISEFNKMDISNKEERDAVLIAISSILQGKRSVGQLSELLSKINIDIKEDGILNSESIIQDLINSASNLNVIQIRDNLTNRYNELGLNIDIPSFEKYAQRLVSLFILSKTPEDLSTNIERDKKISFTFNKIIDANTLNSNSFTLSATSGSTILGEYKLSNNNFTIEFNPAEELSPSTTFSIELNNNLKSIDGTTLSSKYTSQFITESFDVESNLLNHYLLSGNFNDTSGNDNNCIGFSGIFTNDRFNIENSAYYLNDYGDYLDIPRSFNIRSSDWTYSIWFKLDKLPSQKNDVFLLTRKNVDYDSDAMLYVDNDDNAIKVAIVDGHYKLSSGVTVDLNTWYFASVTVSEKGIKLYVNGQFTAETDKKFTNNLSPNEHLSVSAKYTGNWGDIPIEYGKLLGVIDEIRVYDRCLNEREINRVYSNELGSTLKSTKIIKTNQTAGISKSLQTNWQ